MEPSINGLTHLKEKKYFGQASRECGVIYERHHDGKGPQHPLSNRRRGRWQKVVRHPGVILSTVAVVLSVFAIYVVDYLAKEDYFHHEEDLAVIRKEIAKTSAETAFWEKYKSLKRSRQDPYFKKDYNVCVLMNMGESPTEHARGVEVNTQGLVIRHAGLYFVYSSVNFKPNSTEYSANFAYQTWFQYIYKLRPNSPAHSTVLTRVVHTCCLNCTNSQETAFSGGAFNLEVNDMIQVCLTGQGLISFEGSSTFLGLFMLRSANKHK